MPQRYVKSLTAKVDRPPRAYISEAKRQTTDRHRVQRTPRARAVVLPRCIDRRRARAPFLGDLDQLAFSLSGDDQGMCRVCPWHQLPGETVVDRMDHACQGGNPLTDRP